MLSFIREIEFYSNSEKKVYIQKSFKATLRNEMSFFENDWRLSMRTRYLNGLVFGRWAPVYL